MESAHEDQRNASQLLENTENVETTIVSPNISTKKPIQLGVVQSSSGIRSSMGNLIKKSRWDQAPLSIEDEQDTKTKDKESSSSVKSLIQKFEEITGDNKSVNVPNDEELTKHIKPSTPTRVKLVRTNFKKKEITVSNAITEDGQGRSTSDIALSNINDTVTSDIKKDDTVLQFTKESTDTIDKPEESVVPVATSKALQIISSCYDSPTDESSQEGPDSLKNNTPSDSAYSSLEKLNDVDHNSKRFTFLHKTKEIDSNPSTSCNNEEMKEPTNTTSEERNSKSSLDTFPVTSLKCNDIISPSENKTDTVFSTEIHIQFDNQSFSESEGGEIQKTTDSNPDNDLKTSNDHQNKNKSDETNEQSKCVTRSVDFELKNEESTETSRKCVTDTEIETTIDDSKLELISSGSVINNMSNDELSSGGDIQQPIEQFPDDESLTNPRTVSGLITAESKIEDDIELTVKHADKTKETENLERVTPEHVTLEYKSNIEGTTDLSETEIDTVIESKDHDASVVNNKAELTMKHSSDTKKNKTNEEECVSFESETEDSIKITTNISKRSIEEETYHCIEGSLVACKSLESESSTNVEFVMKHPNDDTKGKKFTDYKKNLSEGEADKSKSGDVDELKMEHLTETKEDTIINDMEPCNDDSTKVKSNILHCDEFIINHPSETNEHNIKENTERLTECLRIEPVNEDSNENNRINNTHNFTESISVEAQSNLDTPETKEEKNDTLTNDMTNESKSEEATEVSFMNRSEGKEDEITNNKMLVLEYPLIGSKNEDGIESTLKSPNESKEDTIVEITEFNSECVTIESKVKNIEEMPVEHAKEYNITEHLEPDSITTQSSKNSSELIMEKPIELKDVNDTTEHTTECMKIEPKSEYTIDMTIQNSSESKEDINNSEAFMECLTNESKSEDVQITTKLPIDTEEHKIIEGIESSMSWKTVKTESLDDNIEITAKHPSEVEEDKGIGLKNTNDEIAFGSKDTCNETINLTMPTNDKFFSENKVDHLSAELKSNSVTGSMLLISEKPLPTTKERETYQSVETGQELTKPTQLSEPEQHKKSEKLPSKIEKDSHVSQETFDILKNDEIGSNNDNSIEPKVQNIEGLVDKDDKRTDNVFTDSKVVYDDGVDATMEQIFSEDLGTVNLDFELQKNKTIEKCDQSAQDNIPAETISNEDNFTEQLDHLESNNSLLEVLEAEHSENSSDMFDGKTLKETDHKLNADSKSVGSGKDSTAFSKVIEVEGECLKVDDVSNQVSVELMHKEDSELLLADKNCDNVQEELDKSDSKTYKNSATCDSVIQLVEETAVIEHIKNDSDKSIKSTLTTIPMSNENETDSIVDNPAHSGSPLEVVESQSEQVVEKISENVQTGFSSKSLEIVDNISANNNFGYLENSKVPVNEKVETVATDISIGIKKTETHEFEKGSSTDKSISYTVNTESINNDSVLGTQPDIEINILKDNELKHTKEYVSGKQENLSTHIADILNADETFLLMKEKEFASSSDLNKQVDAIQDDINIECSTNDIAEDSEIGLNNKQTVTTNGGNEKSLKQYTDESIEFLTSESKSTDVVDEENFNHETKLDDILVEADLVKTKIEKNINPFADSQTVENVEYKNNKCTTNVDRKITICQKEKIDSTEKIVEILKDEDNLTITKTLSNLDETNTMEDIDSFLGSPCTTAGKIQKSETNVNTDITLNDHQTCENVETLPDSTENLIVQSHSNVSKLRSLDCPPNTGDKDGLSNNLRVENMFVELSNTSTNEYSKEQTDQSSSSETLECQQEPSSQNKVDTLDNIEKNARPEVLKQSVDIENNESESQSNEKVKISNKSEYVHEKELELLSHKQKTSETIESSTIVTDNKHIIDISEVENSSQQQGPAELKKSLQKPVCDKEVTTELNYESTSISIEKEDVSKSTVTTEVSAGASPTNISILSSTPICNIKATEKEVPRINLVLSEESTKSNTLLSSISEIKELAKDLNDHKNDSKNKLETDIANVSLSLDHSQVSLTDTELRESENEARTNKRAFSSSEDTKESEPVIKIPCNDISLSEKQDIDQSKTKEQKSSDSPILLDKSAEKEDALTGQISDPTGKSSVKTPPKDIMAPVRVSARQKQRQAAAALAAEKKNKNIPDLTTKKVAGVDKTPDKRVRKSVSPTKELQIKISQKSSDNEKSPLIIDQKSPRATDYKISSQISPKKVTKDVGRDKLEPITLKLSKEENPVIIRSSSLSPKRVVSIEKCRLSISVSL